MNKATGKPVLIKDGSNDHNRHFHNIINEAKKDPSKVANVVDMLSQSISYGHQFFNAAIIPMAWIEQAAEKYTKETGRGVEYENTSSSSESEDETHTFAGKFIVKVFDMENLPPKGVIDDLSIISKQVIAYLDRMLDEHKTINVYMVYHVSMKRGTTLELGLGGEPEEVKVLTFSSIGDGSRGEVIKKASDTDEALSMMFSKIIKQMTEYNTNGSGWNYVKSNAMEVNVSGVILRSQSSDSDHRTRELINAGGTYLPLPLWVGKRNRSCYNPKPSQPQQDQRCFIWSVLRALHPAAKDPLVTGKNRVKGYMLDLVRHEGDITLPPDVTFPIEINDQVFRSIEDVNPSFSFSVFHLGEEENDVRPLYLSAYRLSRPAHVQLGLISDGDVNHFVLIKSMSDLLGGSNKGRIFWCECCLTRHYSEEKLRSHMEVCLSNEPTKVVMPYKGGKHHKIIFNRFKDLMPCPFVVYADFEALLTPPEAQLNTEKRKMASKHVPVSWAYHIRPIDGRYNGIKGWNGRPIIEPREHCGEDDCVGKFLDALDYDTRILYEVMKEEDVAAVMTDEDTEDFLNADKCHVCHGAFEEVAGVEGGDFVKVINANKYTGKYMGAAHGECMAKVHKFNKNTVIPVIFHNLRGYDGYHLMRGVYTRLEDVSKIDVIAKNMEKFTAITLNRMRFIDSYQFIRGSLDGLVKNMETDVKKKNDPKLLKEAFSPVFRHMCGGNILTDTESMHKLEFCLQKGIYPYEYMDSSAKLFETRLPPMKAFYSQLKKQGITKQEHKRAKKMWKLFECKNMGDYTNLYCKLDVLLLESVFEQFRASCMSKDAHGLDPCHYLTAPALSWSSMLLMNLKAGIEIENMTDYDMLLMAEKGIRGGMCQVMNPYAKANFGDQTDEEGMPTPQTRILYLDANNLYGWAMSQVLPLGDYEWMMRGASDVKGLIDFVSGHTERIPDLNSFDEEAIVEAIMMLDDEGERGYLLEVDLEYPDEIHDKLNDYPVCPEKKVPVPSNFTEKETTRLKANASERVEKLICDLEPKQKYVIHYRNLKQALQLGVRLTGLHRIISFKQSRWLQAYIDYNTKRRQQATNDIAKEYWKLLNNAIFGKTMEQVRKRRNIKFFGKKDWAKAVKNASSPYARMWRILVDEELMVMEMAKHQILMNRPMILGQVILDLSKWCMFNFHHNVVKPTFDRNVRLLYTDTDSLVYDFQETPDMTVEEKLWRMNRTHNCFDLSDTKVKDHYLLTSDFDGQGRFNVSENAKIPGKFKDESFGYEIEEFIAVRAKMYSVKYKDTGDTKARSKGIPKSALVVQEDKEAKPRGIVHEDYFEVLNGGEPKQVYFDTIMHTKDYVLHTATLFKTGISACDDKSWWSSHYETYRYGHYMTRVDEPIEDPDNCTMYDMYDI